MTPRSPSSWDPCRNSITVSHDPAVLFTGRSLLHGRLVILTHTQYMGTARISSRGTTCPRAPILIKTKGEGPGQGKDKGRAGKGPVAGYLQG
jgi:hypothetical protein